MNWCPSCGQPWRAHPRQPACPRCGEEAGPAPARLLDAWRSLLLGGAYEWPHGPRRLLRLALWPPVLGPLDERRRCVTCVGAEQFGPAAPCDRCGGETVGQALPAAADGSDLRLQRAPWLRGAGRPCAIGLALVWVITWALILRAFFHYQGPVRPLLALLGWGWAGLMAHVAWAQAIRAARLWRLPGAAPACDPAALEAACREVIEPFLERHAVAERGELTRAEREWDLLEQVLAARGLTLPDGRLRPLVVACQLRRDQARYAARLAAEQAAAGGDLVLAHARAVDPGADPALLPALQEALVEARQPLAGLEPRLRAARERLRLEGFTRDLSARAGAG